MAGPINAFTMAQSQFDHVAKLLNLDPQVAEMLRWPTREFKFMIPIHMDDGTMRVFFGYRVQHNDARGPCKGGIPLGGGKGGVAVDPASLSIHEQEKLVRGWIGQIWRNIGPRQDVPAPDVGPNPRMMGWMMDEDSKLVGQYTP